MEQYIYDQENGLWYKLCGDVYLPCISPAEDNAATIGKWGAVLSLYPRTQARVVYQPADYGKAQQPSGRDRFLCKTDVREFIKGTF